MVALVPAYAMFDTLCQMLSRCVANQISHRLPSLGTLNFSRVHLKKKSCPQGTFIPRVNLKRPPPGCRQSTKTHAVGRSWGEVFQHCSPIVHIHSYDSPLTDLEGCFAALSLRTTMAVTTALCSLYCENGLFPLRTWGSRQSGLSSHSGGCRFTSEIVIPNAYISLSNDFEAPLRSSGLCHGTVPMPFDPTDVKISSDRAVPKSLRRAL